ncbi:hypothetical protein BD779DRAFT_1451433, partial [Infundibulicybe gibba]
TSIDIKELTEAKINSPENAIFMSTDEYSSFGKFLIYFDEEAVSCLHMFYDDFLLTMTLLVPNYTQQIHGADGQGIHEDDQWTNFSRRRVQYAWIECCASRPRVPPSACGLCESCAPLWCC